MEWGVQSSEEGCDCSEGRGGVVRVGKGRVE